MPLFAVLSGLGRTRTADALGPVVRDTDGRAFTIPAAFREQLGIDADTLLQITLVGDEMRMRPVRAHAKAAGSPWFLKLYEEFAPVRQAVLDQGLSGEGIDAAIDETVAAVRARHAEGRS